METKVVELEIKDNVKSLRTQLREANLELQRVSQEFGITSAEAVKASKAVAHLRDEMGDLKDLTKAFNPDAKFNALSGSIGGVVNGFQAVEGGMALLGIESDNLQKQMVRLQALMNLSQGLQGLGEARDTFKALGSVIKDSYQNLLKLVAGQQAEVIVAGEVAVATGAEAVATEGATVAQLSLNTAIKANPLGALLTLLVAVTAGVVAYIYATKKSEVAHKSYRETQDELLKTRKESYKYIAKESAGFITQIESLRKTNSGSKERINLIKKINDDYGVTLKNIKDERLFQEQLNKSVADYIAYQKTRFQLQKNEEKIILNLETQEKIKQKIKDTEKEIKNIKIEQSKMGQDSLQAGDLAQRLRDNISLLGEYNLKLTKANQRLVSYSEIGSELQQLQTTLGVSTEGLTGAVDNNTNSVATNVKTNEELLQSLKELKDANEEVAKNETQLLDIKKQRDLDALQVTFDNSLKDETAQKALADAKVLIDIKYYQDLAVIQAKFRQEEIKNEDAQFALHEEATYTEKEKEIALLVKTYEDKFALVGDNAILEQELMTKQKEELKLIEDKYRKESEQKEIETAKKKEETQKANVDKILAQTSLLFNQLGEIADEEARADEIRINNKYARELASAQGNSTLIAQIEKKKQKEIEREQRKAFKVKKASDIAGAIIDGARAVTSTLAEYPKFDGGIAMYASLATTLVATGLAVAKIKNTQFDSGSDSGGASGGGGATSGGVTAPSFNVVGATGGNQLAQLEQQPLKAYVVASEVSSAQELDRNRIMNATF